MQWGKRLAAHLKPGDIVCLCGDLGSGKTTFVKGIAQGLKIKPDQVSSPTFVLMNAYEGRMPMFHFDLYRIEREGEILGLGYEEFLYGEGVAVVEWAERLGHLSPQEALRIEFVHQGGDERLINIAAMGQRYIELLKRLAG